MKYIYVILSQTPSIVAKIIRRVTHDEYCHSAIALDEDLREHYSFGRIYPWCALIGGFVRETVGKGTLWKFRKSEIAVLKVPIEDEQYGKLQAHLEEMYENRKKYRYNYKGLFLARRNIKFTRPYHYYCSEFVTEMLEKFGVIKKDELGEIVRPVGLLNIPSAEIIYKGKLCDYRKFTERTYFKFTRDKRRAGRRYGYAPPRHRLLRPRFVTQARAAEEQR